MKAFWRKDQPPEPFYYRHRCGPGKKDRTSWMQVGTPETCPKCTVRLVFPGKISADGARWCYTVFSIVEWP